MNFTKTSKDLDDQIAILRQRGLRIENEAFARKTLSNVSYYRLSAYFLPFQKYGDPNHIYMSWASFNQVQRLYTFDRELRFIVLDAIERIEVALRCRIIQEFCMRHGNNWYEDPSNYYQDFTNTIRNIRKELARTKEDFIKHYKNKYTNPANPPSWMTIEVLSLGTLSKLFKNLRGNDAKKAVANYFGIHYRVMESWLEQLVYIRNICAHHGRLWNRTITTRAILPTRTAHQWITSTPANPDKLYLSLCTMAYLLNRITNTSHFSGRIKVLLCRFPEVNIRAAGFVTNWEQDIFWKQIKVAKTHTIRIFFFKCRYLLIPKGKIS